MFDSILNALKRLGYGLIHSLSGLPAASTILLLLALAMMAGLIGLTVRALRRAATKPVTPSVPASDEIRNDKLPPMGGWISEFLSKKGYVKVSSLSLSFLRALDFLKQSLDTYNYKYQLPWYLLIGAENSGKTTLMEGADLNLPVGQQDFGIHHGNPECRWWFLNRGVILDIRGDLLLRKTTPHSDEKGWRSLLVLLSRYRAARPLNGILLTIPATELYGRQQLTMDTLSSRAEYLAQKLLAAQNGLGLRVPIYILITKTDIIPGFQSFCTEIPTRNRHNMLGWSSPYTLSTAYTHTWVEDAFSSIQENLSHVRLEIFAEGGATATADGVFVFPSELMTIKNNLGIYLGHLFKSDTYQQALCLRGIYFCGDSGITPLRILEEDEEAKEDLVLRAKSENSKPEVDSSANLELMAVATEPSKRKIFFIEDLITEKIFHEPGVASPQPHKLLSINRILNVAKIAMAVFILLGSYGLFHAYDKFVRSRDYIMPVLGKMNSLLHDLHNLRLDQPDHSNELFDVYARELIEMMEQLQQTQFFSFFVPASWFSPLHEDLHKTLKISYQQVIIRTIYIDLLLKARDLLHLRPATQDQSTSIGQLLLPLATPEYQLFRRYVEGMVTLQEKIDKFNNLKTAPNYRDLNDLVAYTFGAQLPKQFIDHYHRFQDLLSNSVFPPIDLKPYQQMAQETLMVLYHHFLEALFAVHTPYSLSGRLNGLLQQLSQQNNQRLPDAQFLRQFSMELGQVLPTLGEVGQNWLDKDFFNPDKEFDALLDKIDAFPLFGKPLTQTLVDETAVGFYTLKQQLRPLNQLLSDHPTVPSSPSSYSASQGLFALSKSLNALFSEPYMVAPTGRSFTPLPPPGKIIYWDGKLIQLAYDMCKRFDDFVMKQISAFPPLLHENLKLIARQSLQANIIDLVARSQSFVDVPTNLSQGLAAEEVLRSKIADVREAAPKFAKLLEILNQDSVGFSFVELRDLLASTSYWLLSQVEIMLQNLTPYAMHDTTFNWWDGEAGAALTGYSANDLEDLKTYLALQRQQMQNMALDYAKPLVTFLTAPVLVEAEGDKTLLNRWRRIIEQLEAYAKKQPGNSINVLEDFIIKSLNTYNLNTIFSAVSLAEIQQPSGDYFLEIVRQLKKAALSRAEVKRRQLSIEHYKELARYFNQNLKNKFPFVGSNLSLSMAEADPEDIRTFFRKYDEFGGSVKEIINQVYQLGTAALPAVEFLQKMQVLKEFFQNYLQGQGEGDLPTFEFNMDFRANRARESGGDLIVDWSFKPDEDTSIHRNDKQRTGRWIYGNPIQVSFRWPFIESLAIKPVKDPTQPLLSIEGQTATFTFAGHWSLFWLLRLHLAHKGEYVIPQDPNPHMLKFVIPTGAYTKAIVYNLVTLMVPSSNPKISGKIVRVPVFPTSAPPLDALILEYADQPILTEGGIKRAKLPGDDNPAPTTGKAKIDSRKTENPQESEELKNVENKKKEPI